MKIPKSICGFNLSTLGGISMEENRHEGDGGEIPGGCKYVNTAVSQLSSCDVSKSWQLNPK